jgi:uncharacterized lipoprotein
MKKLFLALLVAALAGCSTSPPKPPSCDGANKRPVNKGQQQNTAANPTSYINCV